MPEMSLDTREVIAASEACTSSPSTTDTASVVSPSAANDEHCSSAESHPSLMHLLLPKRLVSNLIKNVKETSVVEAAYTYVKDARSPLVRAVSDHVQPLIDKASPMVAAVVDRIDDRIDATAGRIVDESNEMLSGLVTKKDQVKSAVSSTIEVTKSGAFAIMNIPKGIVNEFRRRRDSLYLNILQGRNSFISEVRNLQHRFEIQAVLQLPSNCITFVKVTVHEMVDSITNRSRLVVTQLYDYRDEAFLVVRNFSSECDLRVVQLREIAANQYAAMCSRKIRMEMFLSNLLFNETLLGLHKSLMDLLFKTRESFTNGCVMAQGNTEALVGKVVSTGQELLMHVPEEKRQFARDLYSQICSKIRQSIGDEKTDAVALYVFESAIADWLRKATLAASA